MKDMSVIMKRFSATPVKETPEEEIALQAIPLQERYSFVKLNYDGENDSITAEYYFYVDSKGFEYLVCELKITAEGKSQLTAEGIKKFVSKIYESGKAIESEKKILPEYIRADKNEEYCFRRMSDDIERFLTKIHEGVVKTEKSEKRVKRPIGFHVR